MKSSEARKAWEKEFVLWVTFKLFRKNGENDNDQDIIDFLEAQPSRSGAIKDALRFYMEHIKEENKK